MCPTKASTLHHQFLKLAQGCKGFVRVYLLLFLATDYNPTTIQPVADVGQRNFVTAANGFAVEQDQWQLGLGRDGGTVGVKQVKVTDRNGRSVPTSQAPAQPVGQLAPAILESFGAGDRGADDVDD
jgi:hypothetical protein